MGAIACPGKRGECEREDPGTPLSPRPQPKRLCVGGSDDSCSTRNDTQTQTAFSLSCCAPAAPAPVDPCAFRALLRARLRRTLEGVKASLALQSPGAAPLPTCPGLQLRGGGRTCGGGAARGGCCFRAAVEARGEGRFARAASDATGEPGSSCSSDGSVSVCGPGLGPVPRPAVADGRISDAYAALAFMAGDVAPALEMLPQTLVDAMDIFARFLKASPPLHPASRPLALTAAGWLAVKLSPDHHRSHPRARRLEAAARHGWPVVVCMERLILKALDWRVAVYIRDR